MAVITHYDNLKVARNAPDSVIRAAYRALAQQYHPDKNGGSVEAERIMMLVNAAYETLSDPEKRREHDAWIEEQERLETLEATRYLRARPSYSAPTALHSVKRTAPSFFGMTSGFAIFCSLLAASLVVGGIAAVGIGIVGATVGLILNRKDRWWAYGWAFAVAGVTVATFYGNQARIKHEAESVRVTPQITQQAQAVPSSPPTQPKCGNKHIPALRKIEARSPELDPCSAKYDQRIVDLIVVRAEQYKAEGQADVDAIVLAYNDYIKSHQIRSE